MRATAAPRRDITYADDLDQLLRRFYGAAFADELLGPVFTDVARMDLEEHLPAIGAFWQRVLLGQGQYSGRPLAKHSALHALTPLTDRHFARWLALWRESLEALFVGPVADLAYHHAERTAASFLRNLDAPAPARSLPLLSANEPPTGGPRT